jgi:hypothetical protein
MALAYLTRAEGTIYIGLGLAYLLGLLVALAACQSPY